MMHGFGFSNFGVYGWIGMILSLVITIVVVGGIIWLVARVARRGFPNQLVNPSASNDSPREILQTRYVRGEINREQYQQMLEDLG